MAGFRDDALHVITVGIRAVNMRKSMEKKRQAALLTIFVASFPIPKYNKPIRRPTEI